LLGALWGRAGPILPALAATLTLTNCKGQTDLRSKISSATARDTVTFSCSGTRAITLGTSLTIDGSGQQVTISGADRVHVHVFVVKSGVTLRCTT
jgi:hypothetical protein